MPSPPGPGARFVRPAAHKGCWALLALKALPEGKSRLTGVLSRTQREQLIRAMLASVIDALAAARELAGIAVVTPQAEVLPAGVLALPDPGAGLNHALASGAGRLEALGARELLVLHTDLPLLDADEIDAFITASRPSGLGLAPDRRGSGTNGLFLALPSAFRFRFGAASLQQHVLEARLHGLRASIAPLPGFAFDVDEPADLAGLLDARGGRLHRPFLPTRSPTWTTSPHDFSPLRLAEHG